MSPEFKLELVLIFGHLCVSFRCWLVQSGSVGVLGISVPFHCEVRSGISWICPAFIIFLTSLNKAWIVGHGIHHIFSDPRGTTDLCHDDHYREESVRLLHNGISAGSCPGLSPVWIQGILPGLNSSVNIGSLAPEEIPLKHKSLKVHLPFYHLLYYWKSFNRLPGSGSWCDASGDVTI